MRLLALLCSGLLLSLHNPFMMGRIMSIDYGLRRSGVAVSDPLQIVAGGLDTVETRLLIDFIVKYTAAEDVERIVVGLPVQNDGTPSENAARGRFEEKSNYTR